MDKSVISSRNDKIISDIVTVNPAQFNESIAQIWKFYFKFRLDFRTLLELREDEQIQ